MAESKQGKPFTRQDLEGIRARGGLAGRLAAALMEQGAETGQAVSNRDAERGVLFLVLTAPELAAAQRLLGQLGARDFWWPDTKFIFCEAATMTAAGSPANDPAAYRAWFQRPDSLGRFREQGLDGEWHHEDGTPAPLPMLADVATDGYFASWAHEEWYVGELRRCRLARGIRLFGTEAVYKIEREAGEPFRVLTWIESQVEQMKKLKPQEKRNGSSPANSERK